MGSWVIQPDGSLKSVPTGSTVVKPHVKPIHTETTHDVIIHQYDLHDLRIGTTLFSRLPKIQCPYCTRIYMKMKNKASKTCPYCNMVLYRENSLITATQVNPASVHKPTMSDKDREKLRKLERKINENKTHSAAVDAYNLVENCLSAGVIDRQQKELLNQYWKML